MSPEERNLLERIAVLTEENNSILRGIRRSNRIGAVVKVLYWVLIIGLSYGAYVSVQPYVDQLVKAYNETTKASQGVSDMLDNISLPIKLK
jgi:hypothetical protein